MGRRPTRPGRRASAGRPKILLLTEGTYPFVVGGVSTWCHQLLAGLPEFSWSVLPIISPTEPREPRFRVPDHVELLPPRIVWREGQPSAVARASAEAQAIPSRLARGLIAWDGDLDELTAALLWCADNPRVVSRAFADRRSWAQWTETFSEILAGDPPEAGSADRRVDAKTRIEMYRTLHWLARVAAAPTPVDVDVVHLTAAGWGTIPALIHHVRHGTPVLLTEHGVYVREAYLAASSPKVAPGERFVATRISRGLARTAYAIADLIAPVTEFNATWERALAPGRAPIRTIHNGVRLPEGPPTPAPRDQVVVAIGRIDPLKDIKTLLRVADRVCRARPAVRFEHYGPVSPGQDGYFAACHRLYQRLELGERFRFAGSTDQPSRAMQGADVILMTSISEGLPITLLEAMALSRPVVATQVGGVRDAVRGAGVVVPPGNVDMLAGAVLMLLDDPDLADELGRRGRARVERHYDIERVFDEYRSALVNVAEGAFR